ncbi:MAG: NUDIX domain-containing protein [Patescibacteria group bacterium]
MNEELFDIYDEQNKPLGMTKSRSIVHKDGSWHRVVHIYVINDQGQYLVHLRSPYKDLHPNCWDARLGGHVVAGMDYDQTAIEELKQEIGITVSLNNLISSKIHKSDNGTNREHSKIYFYKYNGELTDLQFNDNEVVEVKWMSPDDIIKSIEQNPQIWTTTIKGFRGINLIQDSLWNR